MKHIALILSLSLVCFAACAPGRDTHESAEQAPTGGPGLATSQGPQVPNQGLAKQRDSQPVLAQRVDWFDGERASASFVSENLLAESRADEAGRALVLAQVPGASAVYDRGYHRIWQLPLGVSAAATLERLRLSSPTSDFSHVFHHGASPSSPYLTFPGGVFVTLDPDLGDAAALAWFGQLALEVERKLPVEGNVWHVRSGPGLAALALAERLRGESVVVSTSPNRWEPLALR